MWALRNSAGLYPGQYIFHPNSFSLSRYSHIKLKWLSEHTDNKNYINHNVKLYCILELDFQQHFPASSEVFSTMAVIKSNHLVKDLIDNKLLSFMQNMEFVEINRSNKILISDETNNRSHVSLYHYNTTW